MRALLLIFIAVPVLEMWLLIRVGGVIGAWPTIGLVLLTAVVGLALLRQQGFATLVRGVGKLDQGELPAQEMFEGLILAVCGALLLTPGFFTDVVGFAGLLPAPRRWLVGRLLSRAHVVDGAYRRHAAFSKRENVHRETSEGSTLEGEYRRED